MQKADLVIGILFVVFSVAVLLVIPHQVQETVGATGSGFMPKVVSYGLLGLGGLLILSSLFKMKKSNKEKEQEPHEAEAEAESEEEADENLRRISLVAAIAVAYFFLTRYIGYLYATIITLAALFVVFGEKRVWMVALLSIVGAGIIYFVFTDLFYVRLP